MEMNPNKSFWWFTTFDSLPPLLHLIKRQSSSLFTYRLATLPYHTQPDAINFHRAKWNAREIINKCKKINFLVLFGRAPQDLIETRPTDLPANKVFGCEAVILFERMWKPSAPPLSQLDFVCCGIKLVVFGFNKCRKGTDVADDWCLNENRAFRNVGGTIVIYGSVLEL